MNQLSTTSILALFETSKEQRNSFVTDLVERIKEGEVNPLKVHIQVKAMEDIITQLTSTDEKKNKNIASALTYRSFLLDAAEKNGKKFQMFNAEFKIGETGTKYDYSKCGDDDLIAMLAEMEILKSKIDERQSLLKTLPAAGIDMVMQTTGEVVKTYPPSKTSTTSVSVSLK